MIKIDTTKITQVYSGRQGCMCGCRGKHSYAEAFASRHGVYPGYDNRDSISDRNVRRICKIIGNSENTEITPEYFETCEGNRVYVAWRLQEK